MENAVRARLRPHASPLYGDLGATGGKTFGYGWFARTCGLGAIRIQWTSSGLQSVHIRERPSTTDLLMAAYATTKKEHWFRLMDDELVTAIHIGITGDQIRCVHFETNLRQSQWFGAKAETVHCVTPPPGFYIHMIHGRCTGGRCANFGVYFVPLEHQTSSLREYTCVGNSAVIGSVAVDRTSSNSFWWTPIVTRAIVISVDVRLKQIRLLNDTYYSRHLAYREDPLDDGEAMLVLAQDELLTGVCAWVGDDQSIVAIRFMTNRRTTEWFGATPPVGATIETRSMDDQPTATHIGGISGMRGDNCIRAIRVTYYRHEE